MTSHPYNPPHLTKHSRGNVAACCEQPEDQHPAFVHGTVTTVRLTRDVRSLNGHVTPKGTVMSAERSNRADALQEVRPTRWVRNERGNLEEQRGEFVMVNHPGWTVRLGADTHLTGIPWKWAREVAS